MSWYLALDNAIDSVYYKSVASNVLLVTGYSLLVPLFLMLLVTAMTGNRERERLVANSEARRLTCDRREAVLPRFPWPTRLKLAV